MRRKAMRRSRRKDVASGLAAVTWPVQEPMATLVFVLLVVLVGLLLAEILEWRSPHRK